MRSGKHTHSKEYRWVYKDRRWEPLRQAVFARDNHTCKMCGVLCYGRGQSPRAPVCDHIVDVKTDKAKAFDPANLRTLCKTCHDGERRRIDATGYSSAVGEDGYPLDPRHPANR